MVMEEKLYSVFKAATGMQLSKPLEERLSKIKGAGRRRRAVWN
jgi:hypothetical protein